MTVVSWPLWCRGTSRAYGQWFGLLKIPRHALATKFQENTNESSLAEELQAYCQLVFGLWKYLLSRHQISQKIVGYPPSAWHFTSVYLVRVSKSISVKGASNQFFKAACMLWWTLLCLAAGTLRLNYDSPPSAAKEIHSALVLRNFENAFGEPTIVEEENETQLPLPVASTYATWPAKHRALETR